MKTEKKNPSSAAEPIDEKRSLEIISQMIADTAQHIEDQSGKYFLVWGYTTVAVSLFEYFAQLYGCNMALCVWAWWLIPLIGGVATLWMVAHQNKLFGVRPKSYLDRSIGAVWGVFGFSSLFAMVAAVVYGCSMLFLIVMLMGMGTVITGIICRHRALTTCGAVAMLLSLIFPIKHIVLRDMDADAVRSLGDVLLYSDILIFAAIFLVMMVIPGHILQHRKLNKQ